MRVYGVGYSFVGAASLINTIVLEIFADDGPVPIGFVGICYIYGALSVVSFLILVLMFKEEKVDMRKK